MTTTLQMPNVTGIAGSADAVHLLLTEGDVQMMAENPEEDIRQRAEQVSSVLEGILLEPHGISHWGINE
jgi:hypothetical protein